jgi:ABC-type multidrug transport system fused ATPase/permease subunit
MVMDNGIIAEFDTPGNLLQNRGGLFFALAKEASIV